MDTIWAAIVILSALGLACGIMLSYTSHRFTVEDYPVVEKINELLPQSQCGKCGYPGCNSYAKAVYEQREKINRCVPGGEVIMLKIASFLNVDPQQIDNNEEIKKPVRMLAVIDEANCIGCTKCVQVCPVDAIVGSTRTLHTVVSDLCTGCNLCIIPCPTKCIELCPVETTSNNIWK